MAQNAIHFHWYIVMENAVVRGSITQKLLILEILNFGML